MINKKIGDLLIEVQPEFGISKFIVHGTNCQGKYKSGFAGQMRQTYPGAYIAYTRAYNNCGLVLGETTVCGDDSFLIVNANTQEYYGRDLKVQYVSYDAVRSCFREVNELAVPLINSLFVHSDSSEEHIADIQVHFPLIGCGLANGEWDIISKIIEEELDSRLSLFLWTLPETAPNFLNPDLFSFPT